jgi:hypothetical protein
MCHETVFKGFDDARGQGLDPMPLEGTVLGTKDMRGPSRGDHFKGMGYSVQGRRRVFGIGFQQQGSSQGDSSMLFSHPASTGSVMMMMQLQQRRQWLRMLLFFAIAAVAAAIIGNASDIP